MPDFAICARRSIARTSANQLVGRRVQAPQLTSTESLSAAHATVLVMTNSRKEFDRVEVEVDELLPSMTGRWLVVSQGSRHEWDLDSMTYKRIAGQDSKSGRFATDGQRMPITRVGRWPRVGSTSLVFYDDPTRPLDYEQFRRSSRIESITQITPTASVGRPDDSTGYLLLDALADEDPAAAEPVASR